MSCLKLYWPQTLSLYHPGDAGDGAIEYGDDAVEPDGRDAPVILSFPRIAGRIGGGRQYDLLSRARLIFSNRVCPECGRAAAVPVDAEATLMNRNHMPVPGTGRLVGFECDCCGHTWSVS